MTSMCRHRFVVAVVLEEALPSEARSWPAVQTAHLWEELSMAHSQITVIWTGVE